MISFMKYTKHVRKNKTIYVQSLSENSSKVISCGQHCLKPNPDKNIKKKNCIPKLFIQIHAKTPSNISANKILKEYKKDNISCPTDIYFGNIRYV